MRFWYKARYNEGIMNAMRGINGYKIWNCCRPPAPIQDQLWPSSPPARLSARHIQVVVVHGTPRVKMEELLYAAG